MTRPSTVTDLSMVEVVGRYSNFPQPLLSSQSGQGVHYTNRPELPVTTPRVHAIRRRLSPEKLQQLLADYRAGTSANELAQRYDLSRATIRVLLRESGVPRRYQAMPEAEADQVVALYVGGSTIAEVAAMLGRPCSTVQTALTRRRVPMRRRHDHC